MAIQGGAQYPRSQPWARNPGGGRSLAEALAIADRFGIAIPEDVMVAVDEWHVIDDPVAYARYFRWYTSLGSSVAWSAFYTVAGKIPVLIRPEVLQSDEAIVAVLGHEMYEIRELRRLFRESGNVMSAQRLHELVSPGISGNLHDHAWHVADQLVARMRGQT